MKHCLRTRLVRALDGIAYGFLAALVIVCHPSFGATPLGDLGNWHVLPLAGALGATLALPDAEPAGTPRGASVSAVLLPVVSLRSTTG